MKYLFLSGGVASGFALLGYLAKTQVLLAKPAIIILAALILAIALCLIFVRTLSEVLGWDLSATRIAFYWVCFFATLGLVSAIAI
ncbi:MAG: hypothetical protein ACRC2V_00500 [Xenococcaceae cyanobacterium]